MITASETRGRGDRILRVALLASVLVHLVFVILALLANEALQRSLLRSAPSHSAREPQDEVVTISSALHVEKRARPVPAPPRRKPQPRAHAASDGRPPTERSTRPRVRTMPPPAAVPRTAVVVRPTYVPPTILRHELAKTSPRASAQPERSHKAKAPSSSATPRDARAPARTAYAPRQRGRSQTVAPSQPRSQTPPTRAEAPQTGYSQERLAQIERDLARTIAQARANVDPIRTMPHERPAAPKHYRIQMQGRFGTLRRGQGTYSPIKAWRANGLDYYYVSYEFVYADGTYETGSVPWPIHFDPRIDPFVRDDPALVGRTPLPPPPPDYEPPGTLGKALRSYFPKLRFADSD